jgi:hypothetical protein
LNDASSRRSRFAHFFIVHRVVRDQVRHGHFAAHGIGCADNRRFAHAGVTEQRVLDLRG